jgi:hypothetical protein
MAHEDRDDFTVVEDRGWPLLVVRFPPAISAPGMHAFVAAVERAYDRRERFVAVVDAAPVAKVPSAEVRKILTDWLTDPDRSERDRAFTIGTAVVLPSGPVRVLTTAINMVRRPVSPVQLTATLLQAAQWAKRRLVEEGVVLSAEGNALYAELTAPPRAARAK